MINITPYHSTNYNTPEHAQRVADCLSKIDGNKYIVYCECIQGNTTFHFDNADQVKVKYPKPVSTNPTQTFTVKDALSYSSKYATGVQTVAELIEFITTNRKPILDFVQASERVNDGNNTIFSGELH